MVVVDVIVPCKLQLSNEQHDMIRAYPGWIFKVLLQLVEQDLEYKVVWVE